MSEFVQIHYLMNYPPGNPNRDDLGRPKTVNVGGVERQRISSQCLKRTWRMSEAFEEMAQGIRTKDVVGSVEAQLIDKKVEAEKAAEIAENIGAAVGSQPVKDSSEKGAVLTFLTAHEVNRIQELVEKVANGEELTDEDLASIPSKERNGKKWGELRAVSPDVALFGRMVAKEPALGIDAALQVAHAFTVHKAGLEVDYWTGVSDEDPWFDAAQSISEAGAGAGMIDTFTFGGGIFYGYVCVNRSQLEGNLGGDGKAATETMRAILKAMATTTPTGKKTQFATNSRAEYVLIEKGTAQPRHLVGAFHRPLGAGATPKEAADRLLEHKKALDDGYGEKWDEQDFLAGERGSLDDLSKFL